MNAIWAFLEEFFGRMGGSVAGFWAPLAALSSAFFAGYRIGRIRRKAPRDLKRQLAAQEDQLRNLTSQLEAPNTKLGAADTLVRRLTRVGEILALPEGRLWS